MTDVAYYAIGLRVCYAISSTDLAYHAIGRRACYAISGTDVQHAVVGVAHDAVHGVHDPPRRSVPVVRSRLACYAFPTRSPVPTYALCCTRFFVGARYKYWNESHPITWLRVDELFTNKTFEISRSLLRPSFENSLAKGARRWALITSLCLRSARPGTDIAYAANSV
eukprot:1898679-Rhodomonas_salina.1